MKTHILYKNYCLVFRFNPEQSMFNDYEILGYESYLTAYKVYVDFSQN